MFLELIATFAAGFGAAGVVLLLNLLTKGRLPRWAMPVAAGAAMIAMTISNEYGWAGRTVANLPDSIVVVESIDEATWFRPWTDVLPRTVRLIAVDAASAQSRADVPEMRLVDFYLFQRWQPPARATQFVDCQEGNRADVSDAALAEPGLADWRPATPAVIAAACGGDANAG